MHSHSTLFPANSEQFGDVFKLATDSTVPGDFDGAVRVFVDSDLTREQLAREFFILTEKAASSAVEAATIAEKLSGLITDVGKDAATPAAVRAKLTMGMLRITFAEVLGLDLDGDEISKGLGLDLG